MDATVTIKLDPREFDLVRKALECAIDHEAELQQNIKDERQGADKKSKGAIELTKAMVESTQREAQYALLIERLT
jgi:hypothetical protein